MAVPSAVARFGWIPGAELKLINDRIAVLKVSTGTEGLRRTACRAFSRLTFFSHCPSEIRSLDWDWNFSRSRYAPRIMHREHTLGTHTASAAKWASTFTAITVCHHRLPYQHGDEHEQEGQGMIRTLGPYMDQGRIGFSASTRPERFVQQPERASLHRSWLQPNTTTMCERSHPLHLRPMPVRCPDHTYGASLGAYHAANTSSTPRPRERCYCPLRVYDLRDSMDGMYDDNSISITRSITWRTRNDPWVREQLPAATFISPRAAVRGKTAADL